METVAAARIAAGGGCRRGMVAEAADDRGRRQQRDEDYGKPEPGGTVHGFEGVTDGPERS